MKFILPIIFSLTLLTGCLKHTPEMDKQLALEQSLNEESNEEAPQPKKTTSEQSIPSTVHSYIKASNHAWSEHKIPLDPEESKNVKN